MVVQPVVVVSPILIPHLSKLAEGRTEDQERVAEPEVPSEETRNWPAEAAVVGRL